MFPIRSDRDQRGVTLVELMLAIMLSVVVILGAGSIYRGVDRSFKVGAEKVQDRRGASLLTKVVSRRIRVASDFVIYNENNPADPLDTGNSLALLDAAGDVVYRYVWDAANSALADSSGNRVGASHIQSVTFSLDPVSPRTIRLAYQTVDEHGDLVRVETAAALRN